MPSDAVIAVSDLGCGESGHLPYELRFAGNTERSSRGQTRRLAVLRFSWARSDCATHSQPTVGNAHAAVVLFRSCEGHATQTGTQNRVRIAGGGAGRNVVLRRAG